MCGGVWTVYGAFRFYGFEADSLSVCDKTAAGPGARCGSGKRLRDLGVKGILIRAAERRYITEVKCGMPHEELGGAWYFEPVTGEYSDGSPTHEHFHRGREGARAGSRLAAALPIVRRWERIKDMSDLNGKMTMARGTARDRVAIVGGGAASISAGEVVD